MPVININLSHRSLGEPMRDASHGTGKRRGHVKYNLNEEYDPMVPNDYNRMSRELAVRARQAAAPIQLKVEKPEGPKLSADEAFERRLRLLEEEEKRKSAAGQPQQPEGSKDIGLKIMQKLGWKEGKGLGANEQGIMAPLVAKNVGKHIGVIVQGEKQVIPKRGASSSSGGTFGKSHPSDGGTSLTLEGEAISRVLKITCYDCPAETEESISETFEEIMCEFGSLVNINAESSPEHSGFIICCEYEEASQAKVAMEGLLKVTLGFKVGVEFS